MKALLWKEYRELRPMLLVWFAALAAALVLRQIGAVDNAFAGSFMGVFPLLSGLAATALGAELLIRERQSKTVDYLLTRPVSTGRVVWAKFMAGTIGLFLFVGAVLMFGYLLRENPKFSLVMVQTMQRVAYPMLLLVLFPFFWFVYALTFLFSSLVGNRTQAVAATLLSLGGLMSILNAAQERWPLIFLKVAALLPFTDNTGVAVTLAQHPPLLAVVALVWCGPALVVAASAAALFPRRPADRLVWPAIVAAAAILYFLVPRATSAFLGDAPTVAPRGVYSLGDPTGSAIAAEGKRVLVATKGSLLALDFTDPANPRKTDEISLPLWQFSSLAVSGQRVYLAGEHKELPIDRTAVVEVNLSAPESQRIAGMGPAEEFGWIGQPMIVRGYLYVGKGTLLTSALRVFDLSGKEAPRQTSEILITNLYDPKEKLDSHSRFSMCVGGDYAYLASRKSLSILDIRDPAHPKLARRMDLDDGGLNGEIACVGNRLYVQGLWPRKLLVFDLTNPLQPSPRDEFNWPLPSARLAADGTVCVPWPGGVLAFRPNPGYWVRDVLHLREDRPEPRGRVSSLSVTGDYIFALMGGKRLAAFPRPE